MSLKQERKLVIFEGLRAIQRLQSGYTGGSGEDSPTSHNYLLGRNVKDCHTIGSITGLEAKLDSLDIEEVVFNTIEI